MATQNNIIDQVFPETLKILSELIKFQTVSGTSNIKLIEYCELDWDENCLNFHKNKRVVGTASVSQVRREMFQGSSEIWKKYQGYLEPLINKLS